MFSSFFFHALIFELATPMCLGEGSRGRLPAREPRYREAGSGLVGVQQETARRAGTAPCLEEKSLRERGIYQSSPPIAMDRFIFFYGSAEGVPLTICFLPTQDQRGAGRRRGEDAT